MKCLQTKSNVYNIDVEINNNFWQLVNLTSSLNQRELMLRYIDCGINHNLIRNYLQFGWVDVQI